MKLLDITSAVVWVDFFTIALSKMIPMTQSLKVWYKDFGIVAVISDSLVIILGILLAQLISPTASVTNLAILSVIIQIIHDVLFYVFVILGIPTGHNSMIDLFKKYSSEGGAQIILADSIMIGSSVFLADYFSKVDSKIVTFIGLLGAYALTYIIYTR